jgi:hypothetical protein
VQVFGIAFDDVTTIRVRVAGSWHEVAPADNGFYLDVPGAQLADVTLVEGSLANGSTETYSLPDAGTPVSE